MYQPKGGDSFGIGDAIIYGSGAATSDLIRSELTSYGVKLLGSSSSYMQNININMSRRYLPNLQYYFQVNDEYVKNKLKIIAFPFLHRGHWIRSSDRSNGGEFSYHPPIYDINAPDLYIPFMAFGTYLLLSGFLLGIHGKFSPEALGVQLTNGLLCWLCQVLILEATLHTLGDGDVPLLDVVAYGGYIFAGVSISLVARIIMSSYYYHVVYCAVTLWECLCMGMLFVKIVKRILIAEMTCSEKHSSKRHYVLLLLATAQMPLLFWLANVDI